MNGPVAAGFGPALEAQAQSLRLPDHLASAERSPDSVRNVGQQRSTWCRMKSDSQHREIGPTPDQEQPPAMRSQPLADGPSPLRLRLLGLAVLALTAARPAGAA